MSDQKKFPWWIVVVGVGCGSLVCLGVLAAGGTALFLANRSSDSSVPTPIEIVTTTTALEPTTSPTPTGEPATEEPTSQPSVTSEPTQTDPTATQPGMSDGQYRDEFSLIDDFSTDALGWPVFDDGKTILKYENQAYSFQVTEADYYDWSYFPIEFNPNEIWFDVQGLEGLQEGTFGVFCQFQDADNYYYVEFDLADNTYLIGQILAGDNLPLTEQNSAGQYWIESSELNSPATQVNRIGLSCYLDSITLFVNDQWVNEVSVSQPFDQAGEAAFFVYTFDYAGPDGYKVFFDNVEAYQPVQ